MNLKSPCPLRFSPATSLVRELEERNPGQNLARLLLGNGGWSPGACLVELELAFWSECPNQNSRLLPQSVLYENDVGQEIVLVSIGFKGAGAMPPLLAREQCGVSAAGRAMAPSSGKRTHDRAAAGVECHGRTVPRKECPCARAAHPDVPAGPLRHRVRDQPVDEPVPRQSASDRAKAQWHSLHDTLAGLGVKVELHDAAAAACPTSCSPPTPGWCSTGPLLQLAVSATRCEPASRRTSTPGSPSTASRSSTCPRACYHEGAGDALFCGDALFAGYRTRSDVHGHQWVGQAARRAGAAAGTGQPALLPPRHLLLPAGPRRGDLLPDAFDAYGRQGPRGARPEADAGRRRRRRTASAATPWWSARRSSPTPAATKLAAGLRAWGYEPIAVELDEFLKAGGSAKCLTLRLDGEEAAAW